MATAPLLQALAGEYQAREPLDIRLLSIGGVEAVRRVRAGEDFDLVVLAAEAIGSLIEQGWLSARGRMEIAHSNVGIAVKAGAPRPDIGTEARLQAALLSAPTIGYSTGPSGAGLVALLQRWGLHEALQARLVQAPTGRPVGQLVADGTATLGVQQICELQGVAGIELLGSLPRSCAIVTTFSGALKPPSASSASSEAARRFLAYLASAETAQSKRQHGLMAP